jgi:hypothetical protein
MTLAYTDTDGKKYEFDDYQKQAVWKLYGEVRRLGVLLWARPEHVIRELLGELESLRNELAAKEVKLREAEARAMAIVDLAIKSMDS